MCGGDIGAENHVRHGPKQCRRCHTRLGDVHIVGDLGPDLEELGLGLFALFHIVLLPLNRVLTHLLRNVLVLNLSSAFEYDSNAARC